MSDFDSDDTSLQIRKNQPFNTLDLVKDRAFANYLYTAKYYPFLQKFKPYPLIKSFEKTMKMTEYLVKNYKNVHFKIKVTIDRITDYIIYQFEDVRMELSLQDVFFRINRVMLELLDFEIYVSVLRENYLKQEKEGGTMPDFNFMHTKEPVMDVIEGATDEEYDLFLGELSDLLNSNAGSKENKSQNGLTSFKL